MTSPHGLYHGNRHARRVFDGIAERYQGPAQAFSFFQYARWHRFLVSRLELNSETTVLDVCTGTGLVAMRAAKIAGCRVVGLDLSERMLQQAQRNVAALGLARPIGLVRGRAEGLPFQDGSFDVVVFTFLLRYVEDPQSTIQEMSRVLRPGGQMASLEFYVPRGPLLRGLWWLHTRLVLRTGMSLLSPGWQEVGSFLGPSIEEFYKQHPLEVVERMWVSAGIEKPQTKVLSAGGAVLMWGRKVSGEAA